MRRRSLSLALLIALPLATQGQQITMKNMDVYLHIVNSKADIDLRKPSTTRHSSRSEKFTLLSPRKAIRSTHESTGKTKSFAPHYTSRPIMF